MSKVSRRSLAQYAADQLIAGQEASQLAKYLAAALQDSAKSSEYELLIEDIMWELENRGLLAVGKVTSANPLSQSSRRQLNDQLKTATKVKAVVLNESVDESLLGGLRVETAAKIWDNSIRKKLSDLREAF